MKARIDNALKRCFECQIATTTSHTERAQLTDLPARPWAEVEADFRGIDVNE